MRKATDEALETIRMSAADAAFSRRLARRTVVACALVARDLSRGHRALCYGLTRQRSLNLPLPVSNSFS